MLPQLITKLLGRFSFLGSFVYLPHAAPWRGELEADSQCLEFLQVVGCGILTLTTPLWSTTRNLIKNKLLNNVYVQMFNPPISRISWWFFCIIASKSNHNFGYFSSVLLSSSLLSFWPAHEMKLPSICVGSQLCSQLILQQENRMTPGFKQQEHRCCSYFNLTFCLPDRKQSSHWKTQRHHENVLNSSLRKARHTCPFLLVANGRLKYFITYGIASWTPFPQKLSQA